MTTFKPGKAIAWVLAAAASLVMAQDKGKDLAETIMNADIIYFETLGDYDTIELTVSGQGNLFHRTYEGWDVPAINLNESMLADGEYTFELRATPKWNRADKTSVTENGDQRVGLAVAPGTNFVQSGYFRVVNGQFVLPQEEGVLTPVAQSQPHNTTHHSAKAADGEIDQDDDGSDDQVIADDLIVDGSACVGLDCVNGESFGFDTIRLKENNLRIKFQDTSSSASFPSRDWQLTANDSANGGANKFSIDDIDGGRTPFTIEAGAPSHSLYVDDGGRMGLGTSTPVTDIHVVSGNTPTMRLAQDGSSGFTPQTWDVAGNETNFFVRDATNGSTLPLRIRPSAPSNAIFIDTDGDIGMGTSSPSASQHINRSNGTAKLLIQDTTASSTFLSMIEMNNASGGGVAFRMVNGSDTIDFNNTSSEFRVNFNDGDNQEMALDADGNLEIDGTLTTMVPKTVPDYVFEADYALMPMADLEHFVKTNKHLPGIPSQADVQAANYKMNMVELQFQLLEKIEELTLYTIDQQKTIQMLHQRLEQMEQNR